MYYKDFGGKKVSALGMGGIRFPTVEGNVNSIIREDAQVLVDLAMEKGINYFDTSHLYMAGDSEKFLGEALKKYPRESYTVATKFYYCVSDDIEKVFSEQMERLDTGYVDVYMLHSLNDETIEPYTDKARGYIDFILKKQEEGLVKKIGFSSHASPAVLERFLDYYDKFDMALIQLNYLDWTVLDAKRQYEILTEHGIPVWVMEPLKGGRLAKLNGEAASLLTSFAPDRTLASWGMRFLMGLPNVHTVLSGMGTAEEILDNCKTFEKPDPLSKEETALLMRAAEIYKASMGVPCSSCRYCTAGCPAELDIPRIVAAYNEKMIGGDVWRVSKIGLKSASECLGCGECARLCPQKIDIPAIMEKMKGLG